MDPRTYYRAIDRIVPLDFLLGKRVAVGGLGSGGGMVAEFLARAGVGSLLFVERPGEELEEHNIARHVLTYPWLGRPKIEVVAARIHEINPACQIQCLEADIVQESGRVKAALSACDHIACCVDNEPAKHSTNELALALGVTATYGGVYDDGVGGEVFLQWPGQACYACFSTYAQRGIPVPGEERPPVDYANPDTVEPHVIQALYMDICPIAVIQARMALMSLLEPVAPDQALPGNLVLFGNRAHGTLFPRPFHGEIRQIEKNPDCLVCGGSGQDPADFSAEAAQIRALLGVN